MSDIRFNRWLHQSGTGGISQDSTGNIGIGTSVPTMALDIRGDINVGDTININNASGIISATTITATTGTFSGNMSVTGNVSIAGTLTYEDVSNIDAVGIITAQSDIVVGGGLTVTGISTFNNDVKLLDSDKLKFGIGEDLQIYHDPGTGDSFISESGIGNLKLTTSSFRLRNAADTEHIIWANQDAEVRLYHDNSKKFETTSSGAIVTGILTASTFSGNLTGNVTGDLTGNLAGISSIAAISSSISDTATDVFVYDTSKDSDGGAWRKRTQHTSWYNETLNTATRGSRKEFPAVAVIVAEDNGLTIYDGDDPDLPMWMKWTSTTMLRGGTLRKLAVKNGIIALSTVGTYNGLIAIYFISDTARSYRALASSNNTEGFWKDNIAGRNDYSSNNYSNGSGGNDLPAIVAENTNDVAMTVLPNAPIDPSTGLPVPTIAVATDGGVSVIKDDETVVDIRRTSDDDVHHVVLDGDRVIMFMELGAIYVATITSADQSGNPNNNWTVYGSYGGNTSGTDHPAVQAYGAGVDLVSMKDHTFATAGFNDSNNLYKGLSILSENLESSGNGIVAWIRSDFNTGYQHGDIKGAFLSDTTVESLTANTNLASQATQVVTDRLSQENYDDGDTSWYMVDASASDNGYIQIRMNGLTAGQSYLISLTVDGNAALDGGYQHKIERTGQSIIYITHWNGTGAATLTTTFEAVSGNNDLLFYVNAITVNISNFIVRAVDDEDRSVNNKGLQVFGTVTKSAVATGAELVRYSGFSASNYLQQPYNSDLDFGNGDFSVVYWFKQTTHSNYQDAVNRVDAGQNNGSWLIQHINNGSIQFYVRTGGSYSTYLNSGSNLVTNRGWTQIAVVRKSGNYVMYFDGKKIATGSGDTSLTLNNAILQISGRLATNNYPISTGNSISLVRVSASAPSPEQIKKMYEDEKVLFQENAKATLYGSSDAVTALAFDDTTNLLHVGTSAGRSEFQGLRRINNTTDAVTTAISASNGLVAEQ